MSTADRKLRVFLCHASQDKPVVRELYQRLRAEGWIDPWLDTERLLPGQNWDLEIEKAAESADAIIVCLSNNSVSKEGYIQKEIRYALDIALEKPEGTIYIIPIRFDNCQVPRKIKVWQWVDFFPKDIWGPSYEKVVNSLRVRLFELRKLMQGDEMLSNGSVMVMNERKQKRIGKATISETKYTVKNKPIDSEK
jgi:hypothetical protein